MKYIKTYEKNLVYNKDKIFFKIGDHVKPFQSTGGSPESDLIKDKIYTIIKIYPNYHKFQELEFSADPDAICDVQDENGKVLKTWFLKRFELAELEYIENKYNL